MTAITRARQAAADFGLHPVSVEPLGSGHINESFAVATHDGEFVLQRVNTAVLTDVEGMSSNIEAVYRHLGGRLVPEPVPATNGAWAVARDDGVWRAFVRIPGAGAPAVVDATTAASAARLLGRFHARLADLDPETLTETLPRFHDPRRRLEDLREVVDRDPFGRVASVAEEIETAFASSSLVDVAEQIQRAVPRRVAHYDAKLDNFLFRAGAAVCLVDLDTVMPGAWFWDVGDLVRTASTTLAEDCPDPRRAIVDPPLYEAVLDGYRHGVSSEPVAGRPVTPAELDAVDVAGAVVTYEQAVRFLTDWIAGDVYYRTTRPGQNRDRARVQLGLLASMPGPVPRP